MKEYRRGKKEERKIGREKKRSSIGRERRGWWDEKSRKSEAVKGVEEKINDQARLK